MPPGDRADEYRDRARHVDRAESMPPDASGQTCPGEAHVGGIVQEVT
jgi:hypothetical protein